MTRTEALDRAPRNPKLSAVFATGTDGTTWYRACRSGTGEWTLRLYWRVTELVPQGFWGTVPCELEPEGADWVPVWIEPPPP